MNDFPLTQKVLFTTARNYQIEIRDHPESHVAVSVNTESQTVSVYINNRVPDADIAVSVNGKWLDVKSGT